VRMLAATLAALSLTGGTTPAPNRLQVTAKEFYFVVSRQTMPRGPAIVELVNYGEDPHDLRLQRIGAKHIAGTPQVDPNGFFDLNVTLPPGKYRLWCSIANHRQLGMAATFVVR
jgi:plastocyanin